MRYTVLGFLCLCTVIAYLQRLALSAPSKVIEDELGLGPKSMGIVMAVWYWGYAFFQLPTGWFADKFGGKRSLIVFCVVWSLLTALTSISASFWSLLILWGVMGCTQAGLFPCATKAVGATFPSNQKAFASGWLVACMALGAAVAQWLTSRLLGTYSWQEILLIYTVPGLVWAILYSFCTPRIDPVVPLEQKIQAASVPWSKLVTDWNMLLLCGQQFFKAGAIAFFFTWFPRFLKETRGITELEAGELAFWPPLAGMVGGLFGGTLSVWLERKTGNARLARQGMAFVGMLVCTVTAIATYFITDLRFVVFLMSVGAFCGWASGVSGYTVAMVYGGRRVATVFATMNMSGNVGAGLFPFLVGWLVSLTGNWNAALFVFAGMFLSSACCWALLNPKGTLYRDEETSIPNGTTS